MTDDLVAALGIEERGPACRRAPPSEAASRPLSPAPITATSTSARRTSMSGPESDADRSAPETSAAVADRRVDAGRRPAPAERVPGTSGHTRRHRPAARQFPQSPVRHSVPPPAGCRTGPEDRHGDGLAGVECAPGARRRRCGRRRPRRSPRTGRSLAHPCARRVEQRLGLQPRRAAIPDDLDLETATARAVRRRELGRHVAQRE